jgi:hypothetical protein
MAVRSQGGQALNKCNELSISILVKDKSAQHEKFSLKGLNVVMETIQQQIISSYLVNNLTQSIWRISTT